MIIWVMKWVVISLILIILLHYLYIFFKDTLTTPKIKDLVNKPNEKYKDIFKNCNSKNMENKEGNMENKEGNMENKKGNMENKKGNMENELNDFFNEINDDNKNDDNKNDDNKNDDNKNYDNYTVNDIFSNSFTNIN